MDEHTFENEFSPNLVGKYLAGEASPDEVIKVEDWISISPANKVLFDQYISTWNGLQPSNGYHAPDKAAAWRKINEAISAREKKMGIFRNLVTHYRVAAVIAGIAVLSIIPFVFLIKGKGDAGKQISFISIEGIKSNILPDGSSIVLNSNSSIRFPEKFKANQRHAELQGEAFFKIVPDNHRPFLISFQDISIQVIGTSFNVSSSPEGEYVETQVSSGQVKMFNEKGQVVIAAGETGIYNKRGNLFSLKHNLDINSFSYATRNFVFSDEELVKIIMYLEKAYSKKIVLENYQIGKCKMTSSFNNKSIEYIMDVIATTLDITFTIKGDTIFIKGGEHEGC